MPANTLSLKKRRRSEAGVPRCTTCYTIRGKHVYLNAFAAITQVSRRIVKDHALDVSVTEAFERYSTERSSAQKGKKGINRTTVIAFLKRYAEIHGILWPTGRSGTDRGYATSFHSDTLKIDVYNVYKMQW